jgi:hypothetical protein
MNNSGYLKKKLPFLCNAVKMVYLCVFQEQAPYSGGTPLAMLAAQCNKITTPSPPPLAEATVGKSFIPWKKSPVGAAQPPASGFHLSSSARGSLTSPLSMQSNGLSYSRGSPVGTPTGNPPIGVYPGGSEHFLYPTTTASAQSEHLSQVSTCSFVC